MSMDTLLYCVHWEPLNKYKLFVVYYSNALYLFLLYRLGSSSSSLLVVHTLSSSLISEVALCTNPTVRHI